MSALDRAHADVTRALASALVLQLGGASGTLAALGEHALDIAKAMASELDLAAPTLPWHAHRDRLATLASALGVAVGTMGKIARDVALLSQTEVAEAFEASAEGRGGSSTMPQKRNPVSASVILAAAMRAPGLVATMLAAMPQEHERALGGWQAEWETLPLLVRIAAGAARHTAEMLGGLEVDTARMGANANMTLGVSMSEAVSMELAMHIGKFDAHRTIGAASKRARDEKRPLAELLAGMPEVTKHLKPDDIARALDPANYLGAAEQLVRNALAEHDRAREHDGDPRSASPARRT
jgi:3-carboxy-cis,cis-muconate cycloisomerase